VVFAGGVLADRAIGGLRATRSARSSDRLRHDRRPDRAHPRRVRARRQRWLLGPSSNRPERALLGVYAASSAADVRSAVGSLPHAEQAQLVVKVYKILAIPTAAERTEALLEALQDPTAPLFRWRRVDAFESAASCERQRELALQGFELEASRVAPRTLATRSSPERTGDSSRGGPPAQEPLRARVALAAR